ncbi:MAG: DnaB-like helicase C-terminal domain-containing protein [Pseudomonadota bacterium]|nr:DnaB-like helicase C-terminal domain-containing protein [Pseudomonadota bacterium]
MSGDGTPALPRTPPYCIESEQSVLGAVMIQNSAYFAVSAVVVTEDFYRHDHQILWRRLAAMIKAGKPVDFVTAAGELKDHGELDAVGGLAYLGMLANDTPSAANAVAYAERVSDFAKRRRIIAYAGDLAERAWTTPADELTGTITTGLNALLSRSTATSKRFVDAVNDADASIRASRARKLAGGTAGAPTGLSTLDRLTGGFSGPRLILMAARPKCGKSALLNQFALNAAASGWPGLIVSLELGADELAIRAMASAGQVSVTKLHRGGEEELEIAARATVALGDLPLWIDTESTKLDAILAQAALHRHKHGIKWFAVDHIGLVKTSGRFNTRNDQLGHISWSLKEMAKRLGIPCIALSQLGRECDKHNRRPRPDDLRDSGNLEQDADMVVMLHTPQADREKPIKPLQIGVPANRIGPSCWPDVWFEFDGRTQTIRETADRVGDH